MAYPLLVKHAEVETIMYTIDVEQPTIQAEKKIDKGRREEQI